MSRFDAKLLAVGFVLVIGALIFHNLTYHPSPTPVVTGWSQTPTQSQQPHNVVRRLLAKGIENDLLRAGFDVQVTFIQEDDSRMIIYGKSVNRPFAHNLMARSGFRRLLHDGKFTQVTFLDSMTFPDFSQVYQVPVDSDVKTSTTPAPVVKSGRDDAAFVIQNCGKPDREFTERASGATIRHLVYRGFNTELFFFRDADRPQWGLGNAFLPDRDEDMSMEEANRRMPCAKGQLHSFLESK